MQEMPIEQGFLTNADTANDARNIDSLRRKTRHSSGPHSGKSYAAECSDPKRLKKLRRRLEKYRRITEAGCWEWTGTKNQHGYGRMCVSDDKRVRLIAVHRLAYEIYRGAILSGSLIMHTCDNRSCFNPDHLEQGRQKANIHDMVNKGRLVLPTGPYVGPLLPKPETAPVHPMPWPKIPVYTLPPDLSGTKLQIWLRERWQISAAPCSGSWLR